MKAETQRGQSPVRVGAELAQPLSLRGHCFLFSRHPQVRVSSNWAMFLHRARLADSAGKGEEGLPLATGAEAASRSAEPSGVPERAGRGGPPGVGGASGTAPFYRLLEATPLPGPSCPVGRFLRAQRLPESLICRISSFVHLCISKKQ